MRRVFDIWCVYPSDFSMGWNFLNTNKHFAKNLFLVLRALYFAWKYCFLPSWESEIQLEAVLTLVFSFATKYIVYWGEEGFIACVDIMIPHCSNNLVNRKKKVQMYLFWHR